MIFLYAEIEINITYIRDLSHTEFVFFEYKNAERSRISEAGTRSSLEEFSRGT
jgi:hypothetical protein